MELTIAIVLYWNLILVTSEAIDQIGRRSTIRFDNADITVAVKTPQGIQIAEAFNATEGVTDLQKMRWVSLGVPRLVANKRSEGGLNSFDSDEIRTLNPFEKTADGFFIYVQTLNKEVAEILANEASLRYGMKIQASQFLPLDKHIGKFECESKIYDQAAKVYHKLKGESKFIGNPIRVFFNIDENSRKANLIANLKDPLIIKCLIESHARKIYKNLLLITASQIRDFGLDEMLFGPSAPEVYVTRNQMQLFSSKINQLLDIYEEYDIKEKETEKKFGDNIVSLLSERSFEEVEFYQAIRHLSTFGMNFKEDLSPDIIEKNLTTIFKVEDYGNKSHIVLYNERQEHRSEATSSSNEVSAGFSLFGLFDIGGSVEYYNSRRNDYDFKSKDYSEQLKEINTHAENGVQFYVEGRIIRPKCLNVAKLLRSRMERNLSFSRIYKYSGEATLRERISLTTDEFIVADLVQESVYELKTSQNAFFLEMNLSMNSIANELKSSVKSELKSVNQSLHCILGLQENDGIECSKLKGYIYAWFILHAPHPQSHKISSFSNLQKFYDNCRQ